jgi:hypothetical protein
MDIRHRRQQSIVRAGSSNKLKQSGLKTDLGNLVLYAGADLMMSTQIVTEQLSNRACIVPTTWRHSRSRSVADQALELIEFTNAQQGNKQ